MEDVQELKKQQAALQKKIAALEQEPVTEPQEYHYKKTSPQQTPQKQPAPISANTFIAWAGGIIFALGLLFFVVYALEQGWVTKTLQILIGVATGALLMLGGSFLAKKKPLQGVLIAGAGLALAYFSVYAGYALPTYREAIGITFGLTAALLALVMSVGAYLSAHLKSSSLLVQTMLLAHLALFLADTGWMTVLYLFIITASFSVFVAANAWRNAAYFGGAISFVTLLLLSTLIDPVQGLALVAGLFIIYTWLSIYRNNKLAQTLVIIGTTFVGLILATRNAFPDHYFVLALLIITLLLGAIIPGQRRNQWYFVCATALATLWIPMALGNLVITPALFMLLTLAALIGAHKPKSYVAEAAGVLMLIPVGKLLFFDTWYPDVTTRLLAFTFAIVTLALISWQYKIHDRAEKIYPATLLALTAVVWLLIDVPTIYATSAIIALALSLWLITKTTTYPELRYLFFITLGFIASKLLWYDSWSTSVGMTGRLLGFGLYAAALVALRVFDQEAGLTLKKIYVIIAALSLALLIIIELSGMKITLLLGLLGAIAYSIGTVKDLSEARLIGLVCITLSILKLFLIDTLALSPGLRVIAYIVLGALLLGASLFYAHKKTS